MYTRKDIVYSDAGKILVSNNKIGYEMPVSDIDSIHEEDIVINDMKPLGKRLISYFGGRIISERHSEYSYADWKKEIIKWRYTNDDQLAIILNKDESEEDSMLFKKMQEWRTWASVLAKKIMSL